MKTRNHKTAVRALSIVIIGFLCCGIHAQSTTTRFYNNRSLGQEVPARRAKFSETRWGEPDGRVTTEVKDLRRNEVISRETYKGDEPFGVWFYKGNDGHNIVLDYEFEVVYSSMPEKDEESSKMRGNFFEDNDSLGYKAPGIVSGEKDLARFVIHNMY